MEFFGQGHDLGNSLEIVAAVCPQHHGIALVIGIARHESPQFAPQLFQVVNQFVVEIDPAVPVQRDDIFSGAVFADRGRFRQVDRDPGNRHEGTADHKENEQQEKDIDKGDQVRSAVDGLEPGPDPPCQNGFISRQIHFSCGLPYGQRNK